MTSTYYFRRCVRTKPDMETADLYGGGMGEGRESGVWVEEDRTRKGCYFYLR